MCWAINRALRKKYNKSLHLQFENQFNIQVEASGFLQTRGWKKVAPRIVQFERGGGRGVTEDKVRVKI